MTTEAELTELVAEEIGKELDATLHPYDFWETDELERLSLEERAEYNAFVARRNARRGL